MSYSVQVAASLAAAVLIVMAVIAIVTNAIGPGLDRDELELREERQEQREERREERTELREERLDE